MNNIFGGGGGSTDQATADALASGGGDPFGGTGGSDLGTLFSSIGQAFAGGGANPASSPAGTIDAIQNATDPTGSIAAQTAITGGQGGANAPQPTQTQNPQGPQGQQGGGQDQFAPPSAVDALKKALTGLRQQQRQNPYAFPNSNSPMLNRASRIPTNEVPNAPAQPDDPNAPSQYASAMEFSNDNPPPPQPNTIDPADAVRAGLRSNAPDTSGQFKIPGAANENAASEDFPAYLKNLRGGGGGPAPEVPPQTGGPAPPEGGGPPAGDDGLGALASIARVMGLVPTAVATAPLVASTVPAETGEAPTNAWFQRPSGVGGDPTQAPPAPGQPPPALGGGPGNEMDPKGYTGTTGKKVETVDPKTKKPVDPKTGDPLPTKTGKLPTHKGPQETPTGYDQRVGPIMRDVSGVSHGVPPALGQLAQMAMPLLMMAMGGLGGGGRGRHGFGGRGFGGMGHPGGRGMWPYHHPSFGWGMHGFHPGGMWRPMHPVHFRQMGGGGGGMDPQALSALLGGGGQQGGGQPQGSPQGGQPQGDGGNQFGGDDVKPASPTTMTQAKDDMGYLQGLGMSQAGAAALLGNGWQESNLNPTGPAGDSGASRGMFQWDPNRYAAMSMWAREQGLNPNDRRTQLGYAVNELKQYYPQLWQQLQQGGDVGQLTQAIFSIFERGDPKLANMKNRTSFAQNMMGTNTQEAAAKPGTVPSGGSKAPNPQGNPAPPAVVGTQMDAEGGPG
jgi:hypothetical protein